MLKSFFVPINSAGWPFIGVFSAVTVVLAYLSESAGWIGLIVTTWCVYFFRDPERVTPSDQNLIISPADGVIQSIQLAVPPPELEMGDEPLNRVAIFMNVFNVHVNRIPIAGIISKLAYRPGKFLNASFDKASEYNERQSIKITLPNNIEIAVIQIAGLIARRIKCDITENQTVKSGMRFGLIRFGSRVDIYLPTNIPISVIPGQLAISGETVIGNIASVKDPISGEDQ